MLLPARIPSSVLLLAGWLAAGLPLFGQSGLSRAAREAQAMVIMGAYEEAEELGTMMAEYGRHDPQLVDAWLDARLALGDYDDAAELASESAERFEGHIPSQVRAIEVLRTTGRDERAGALLEALDELAKQANPRSLSGAELVALGHAARMLGAEPKLVMREFFQRAQQVDPETWQAPLATARLAIEKGDYALASRVLTDARTRIGPLPDLIHLQALAQSPSDRTQAEAYIGQALEQNPRHLPSLLLRAEHAIDFEDYDRAREVLAEVRETNPRHPLAWAFEAAIAHLLDRDDEGRAARRKALEPWPKNPEVDHQIGLKLSQMRRFTEGAGFLRRALEADPDHLPSKKELGRDLLRLGRDEEGWALIREVREADPYDVEVYNLMLLHDQLEQFETLKAGRFIVRLPPDEAAIYGPRVLELLAEADRWLGRSYGYRPDGPVVVDFFPEQQDFAVRTLGIPGGLGIVGACFGNVIAMNSPGSPGALGSNWESTLWHEYCHTVTLGATDSRIPRWLTEGISVYQEHARDPSCAGQMTPEFRRRILADDGLIPIAELSRALTAFSDPETIGFAYFEAYLLVRYLIETSGLDDLRLVLDDLRGNGVIEEVLARRIAPLEKLEEGFTTVARSWARELAPDADWQVPEPDSPLWRDPQGVAGLLRENPNLLWALSMHGEFLLAEERWEEAIEPARRLVELHPDFVEPGNGYSILARACRQLGDDAEERVTLRAWAERDGDAAEVFLRLVELDLTAEDWEALAWSAGRVLEVNPMLRAPHRALGISAEARGEVDEAIGAFERLLRLEPLNPADIHHRLARLHRGRDDALAKRHVLLALEEAPRFRAAHRLFRELNPPPATPR